VGGAGEHEALPGVGEGGGQPGAGAGRLSIQGPQTQILSVRSQATLRYFMLDPKTERFFLNPLFFAPA
jgi:hypothetical protein